MSAYLLHWLHVRPGISLFVSKAPAAAAVALSEWRPSGLSVSLQANLPALCAALMNCPIGWAACSVYDGSPAEVSVSATSIVFVVL